MFITEIGTCKCWGDPHCLSFDRRWNHFQGQCRYVLAQDNCNEGIPESSPTFQVIQKNWARDEDDTRISWPKEVTVRVHDLVRIIRYGKKGLVFTTSDIAEPNIK